MRRSLATAALGVALGCLAPPAASAQTLDDIIAMNLKAKGGLDKIRATTTVRMSGHVSAVDEPGGSEQRATIVMVAKRPNLMRREQSVNGEVMVSAFDGTSLWMSRSGMPPRLAPGPQAAYARQDAEFDSVFVDYKEKGHTITLVGREKRDGADVFHLKVTKKGGPPQDYYLDAETGLERVVSVSVKQGESQTTIATELGDYREVDGRMVPFQIRQRVNGTVTASTTIDKMNFNTPVDDAIFRMPGRQ